jgi:septum formation protein
MEVILASASPRRKELLKEIVESFEILPAKGEENCSEKSPKKLVKALSKQKAEEIFALETAKGKIVLGADTVVALGDEVLGKPKDEADAKRMLTALSGRSHDVYTGVCIVYLDENGNLTTLVDAARTEVVFETLSKEQIDAYVASGSPMDKAGAYGIQDGGLVKGIKGSYTNVVGFPLELVRKMIKKAEKKWND